MGRDAKGNTRQKATPVDMFLLPVLLADHPEVPSAPAARTDSAPALKCYSMRAADQRHRARESMKTDLIGKDRAQRRAQQCR